MTAIQAPIDLASATRVGPRTYRKQVLAKRSIDYPMPDGSTRRVDFDDAFLTDLANAYRDGAYDLVPFQLADPANRHNEDPRQYGGRVIGAEVTPDGLDLILELSEEADALVQRTGGRLGVSARIKAVKHVDGRTFKRAIRHVLGTLDPRMQGLRPWEPVTVDLSNDDDEPVLDLSGYPYTQEGSTMPRIIDLSRLDPEVLEQLDTLTALEGIDLSAAEVAPDEDPADDEPDLDTDEADEEEPDLEDEESDEDDGDADSEVSDEELEALIDAELEASLSLSDDEESDDDLDLAESITDGDEDQVTGAVDERASLRFRLASQHYARKGVPPHLIDLAEPILSLSDDDAHSLDLSSPATGETVDVRGIVRDMLDAVAGTINLSAEDGYSHDEGHSEQAEDRAQAWVDYIENN